jgi:hypothetical protein
MKRWIAVVLGLAVALPAGAGAAPKSIFRFEKDSKTVEKPASEAEEGETTSGNAGANAGPLDPEGAPNAESSAAFPAGIGTAGADAGPVDPEGAPNAEPSAAFPAGIGTAGESAAPGLLPGTPAVLDPVIPGAPLGPRFREPPPDAGRAGESAGGSVGIPPRPPTPKPFVYAPAPRGAGTATGYDASVAPPSAVRVPAPAPIVSGQPPPRPRVLPRLAPYGSALPPDHTVPPAAVPR